MIGERVAICNDVPARVREWANKVKEMDQNCGPCEHARIVQRARRQKLALAAAAVFWHEPTICVPTTQRDESKSECELRPQCSTNTGARGSSRMILLPLLLGRRHGRARAAATSRRHANERMDANQLTNKERARSAAAHCAHVLLLLSAGAMRRAAAAESNFRCVAALGPDAAFDLSGVARAQTQLTVVGCAFFISHTQANCLRMRRFSTKTTSNATRNGERSFHALPLPLPPRRMSVRL